MGEIVVDLGSRKIQLIHGSAFVNLPKAWIRTNNLWKGDKLCIGLRRDGTLEISCHVSSEMRGIS